jgi:hypothetical protein
MADRSPIELPIAPPAVTRTARHVRSAAQRRRQNRIIRGTLAQAKAAAIVAPSLELDGIDTKQAQSWAASLDELLIVLRALRHSLAERAAGHPGHQTTLSERAAGNARAAWTEPPGRRPVARVA